MSTTSQAGPRPARNPGQASRTTRGLRLLRERGHEIREVGEDTYRVPSTTGRGYYRADLAAGTCECADHEHRGAFCLHLVVVVVYSRKYTVSLDRETCTCPDFGKRREACKHLFAVVVYAAKKNAGCRRQRTGRPAGAPQRRHAGRTERPRDDRGDDGRGSGPARRRGVSEGLDPARVRANVSRMVD